MSILFGETHMSEQELLDFLRSVVVSSSDNTLEVLSNSTPRMVVLEED